MKFQVDKHFVIQVTDRMIGYPGEKGSRYIEAEYPLIESAELYVLRLDYGAGQSFELPLAGICTTVPEKLPAVCGTVRCQLCAIRTAGRIRSVIRETEIFDGFVRPGILMDAALPGVSGSEKEVTDR